MSKTKVEQPSAGAMRAAKALYPHFADPSEPIAVAELIDRETGAKDWAEQKRVMLEALIELDKVLCDNSEVTDNNVVYWFNRYLPEMNAAIQKARAAIKKAKGE